MSADNLRPSPESVRAMLDNIDSHNLFEQMLDGQYNPTGIRYASDADPAAYTATATGATT